MAAVFITFVLVCGGLPVLAQKLEEEVRYQARDSIRYDLERQTVYLYGAATVKYQDIQMNADRIAFDFKNEEAHAFGAPDSTGTVVGKPSFTQGGHTIDSDSIRYSFRTKQGLIRQVRTHEEEIWVDAGLSKRHADGEVHSRKGRLTTCDRPNPHYYFQVGKMIVIPDDKIITGPALMKVRKVPMPLAVPFGLFPNKKGGSNGVLIPTWGVNDELGYYLLNGGWYQSFGERADMSLTGDIYSHGSWALRAATRYNTRYRYNGSLLLSYSNLLTGDPESPDFVRDRNYAVTWRHFVDAKSSLSDRFQASVNFATSDNYTNNFNSSFENYLSNTFQSNISWTHLWPGKPYTLAVNALHRQNTLNRTFSINLPSVTFNLQRYVIADLFRRPGGAPRWYDQFAVTYTGNFDNQLTTTEDQISMENVPTLAREAKNGFKHTASLSSTFKTRFFSLNPGITVVDRMYFEQIRQTAVTVYDPIYIGGDTTYTVEDTIPRFAAPFEVQGIGATLTSKLYGMYLFRGDGLLAIRHTITPSANFTYRPDNSTRIEGPFGVDGAPSSYSPFQNGIYGEPSVGESGLLSLGLIQNLEGKVRDHKKAAMDSTGTDDPATKKIKIIDFFGINSGYDILRDSVKWSPIGLSARTALFNTININVNSTWDPYAVDAEGQRIDRSERSVSGALARMTYTNAAIGFDVKSRKYGQTAGQDTNDPQVVKDSDPSKGARINFSMPWRLGVNYSYDLTRDYLGGAPTDTERQSVLFNGDVTVFKYWKLGWSSGYDLVAQDLTPTTLNLYWDLHCWEFNFNIIPIGERRSFSFRINVKASILRDMKYEQRLPYGNSNNLLY